MRAPNPPERLFRVHRDGPDRLVLRERREVYGLDRNINMAIGSARREATRASKEGFRVVVQVEQPDGGWHQEFTMDPPK